MNLMGEETLAVFVLLVAFWCVSGLGKFSGEFGIKSCLGRQ